MSKSSFFFNNINNDYIDSSLIKNLEDYSNKYLKNIYLINKPLSEKKYDYTVNKVLIFLCPDYNIQFVNLSLNQEDFEEMFLDFIEDLGYLSDKYNYKKIIGRPRVWKGFIKASDLTSFCKCISSESNIQNFMEENKLSTDSDKRIVKLLISLLTGSINSADKVGKELPKTTLEKVKQNIILFDGDQTRFIFENDYDDEVIKIQGLAGTGKTELLLHRLKEIYVSDKDEYKIVFTCQSKTLANKLKVRITEFFNFMKVEEQIEWDERLWVMHAWGSANDKHNLGTYGMICRKYKLPFYTAGDGSFANACKKTLEYIKTSNIKIEPCFDYMLIDEGQDFTDSFIELCSLVTKYQVFVAGDIFQDIFGIQKFETKPHYLLNKCYRTDPRTLMFSHALGLALYEKPILRFLKDEEWTACGYEFKKDNNKYIINREPVQRFDDIDSITTSSSINLIHYNEYKTDNIIEVIKSIQKNFPDVTPDDIAIVFTNERVDYRKIDHLSLRLFKEFGWNINLLYNTKTTYPDTLAISNKNNIKGLEFPFLICIADYIVTDDLSLRNTLYMTLTRSFISSYLLIQESNNINLINSLNKALTDINTNLEMIVTEPTEEERKRQSILIEQYNKPILNQHEILNTIFNELKLSTKERTRFREAVTIFRPNETDSEKLKEFIKVLLGENNG